MQHKIIAEHDDKMKKTVEVTKKNYGGIRTGRASPALLDKIVVEYYGAPTPLKQLATISVPDPKSMLIQPFDKTAMQEIEKAILKSELGITPRVEAGLVRLIFPPLSEERRKELAKMVKHGAEESKVALRNIRRDGHELLKKELKDKKITEDEEKRLQEELQKITDHHSVEIDRLTKIKESEIMEV
jgi:ribosome recycling factor